LWKNAQNLKFQKVAAKTRKNTRFAEILNKIHSTVVQEHEKFGRKLSSSQKSQHDKRTRISKNDKRIELKKKPPQDSICFS
jgi:hypothetical protein